MSVASVVVIFHMLALLSFFLHSLFLFRKILLKKSEKRLNPGRLHLPISHPFFLNILFSQNWASKMLPMRFQVLTLLLQTNLQTYPDAYIWKTDGQTAKVFHFFILFSNSLFFLLFWIFSSTWPIPLPLRRSLWPVSFAEELFWWVGTMWKSSVFVQPLWVKDCASQLGS